MANFLRQIVASPRARHAEADLDLCYVTDHMIATSGPSQTYPQRAYRNPLDRLVAFLDDKHGEDWAIWEFRAEGTGYPDNLVYDRVRHYPWPDHHPPPFRLVPMIVGSMRNWLHGGDLDGYSDEAGQAKEKKKLRRFSLKSEERRKEETREKRVVVVHCKAGKGRSGTATCSYLISEEGWAAEDALARFTERRMRPRFGAGVSIPSQLRTVSYVDRWTNKGEKRYTDRPVEITEIHFWGLRHGVKVDVAGFGDEGKKIVVKHTFRKGERVVVEGGMDDAGWGSELGEMVKSMAGYGADPRREAPEEAPLSESANLDHAKRSTDNKDKDSGKTSLKKKGTNLIHKAASSTSLHKTHDHMDEAPQGEAAEHKNEPGGQAVILRPAQPIRIDNSDVQIALERRNKTNKSLGFTMVTAVAHVWFNVYFEGNGPEQGGKPDTEGVFNIDWEAMDGIKGSSRKGARAMDRMSVVWRAITDGEEVDEPREGEPVKQMKPAAWQGDGAGADSARAEAGKEKELGLRDQSPESADVSYASSVVTAEEKGQNKEQDDESFEGVRTSGPTGEELYDLEDGKREGGDEQGRGRTADDIVGHPDTARGTTKAGDSKVV